MLDNLIINRNKSLTDLYRADSAGRSGADSQSSTLPSTGSTATRMRIWINRGRSITGIPRR
jgi:hypothetical protein